MASPNSLSKLAMDSQTDSFSGCSPRLIALAEELRLYKPPRQIYEIDVEEERIEDSSGKAVSKVCFPESATQVANQPKKFRPKRGAVLICLFEGDDGDLRVILTKRASKLSTHSSQCFSIGLINLTTDF